MPRLKKGTVISTKAEKTITVRVDTYQTHKKYNKRFLVSSKFHAHDAESKAHEGDIVIIEETAPISATKHWKLKEIITSTK